MKKMLNVFDQVGPVSKAVALVGVPSLVAMYLVWFVTSVVGTQTASASTVASQNNRAIVALHARVEQMHSERDQQLDTQIRLLRIICAQNARNTAQVQACLQ